MFKVQFCSCGGMFVPYAGIMKCRSCGKETKIEEDAKITGEERKEDIIVVEDNKPDLPTTDKTCAKCGNSEAYYWLIQTRSSDEPPTQFFRCVKCRHVWREYK